MALIGMGSGSVMMLNWLDALELAVKHDFEAFEILAQFPQYDPDQVSDEDKQKAREFLKSSGLALSIHAPFSSLNIATPNNGIREAWVAIWLLSIMETTFSTRPGKSRRSWQNCNGIKILTP